MQHQPQHNYMRHQGRALTLLQLWAISRGDDLRGSEHYDMSAGKVFGAYAPQSIVGPDPFYKLQVLKDESKSNKEARPELIGATRHADPLLCAVNAVATMFLLRFGKGGLLPFPDMFNFSIDWPSQNHLMTNEEGTGPLSYDAHAMLFDQMKTAAGLEIALHGVSTKLRSFGAMHASDYQASHPEIERKGR